MSGSSARGVDFAVPENDAAFDLFFQRLLERVEQVENSLRLEANRDNELAIPGEALEENLEAIAKQLAEGDKQLESSIAKDTSNLETAKQKHEEVMEEFNDFCNWHLVEPRSLFWRTLDKFGFYLTVILSFIFVVPFTAFYSKALRFFRSRRRKRSKSYERPAWTTGHGEVEPDFSPSDFFGEGGLARLAMNPLRLSSTSLGGEHHPMELESPIEPDTFLVSPSMNGGSASNFAPVLNDSSKSMKPAESAYQDPVDSTKTESNRVLRRRRTTKDRHPSLTFDDEQGNSFSADYGSQITEEGNEPRVSEPDSSSYAEDHATDRENTQRRKERAGWVIEQNQNWGAHENQNSKDFWESFGDIGRKSSTG